MQPNANSNPPVLPPLPPQAVATVPNNDESTSAKSGAQSSLSSAITPDSADDGDRIEKEWVTRARQVLGDNNDDPYMQSQTFAELRADYMKKRYNKDMKVDS